MLPSLLTLLKSYKLNGLIQQWIITQIHALAVALNQPAIIDAALRALPDSEEANRLRRAWERLQKKHQGSDLARTLDLQIDRQVGAVHDRLASLIKEQSRLSPAAQAMMEQSFPRGLAHHVNAPHIEQAGHNLNLLTVLKDDTHATVIDYLHLGDLRAALESLIPPFNAAIGLGEAVTTEQVHTAELTGENAVMKLVCTIIATFDEKKEEELRLRDQLLRPFLGANEMLANVYAQRLKKKAAESCEDGSKKEGETGGEKKPTETKDAGEATKTGGDAAAPSTTSDAEPATPGTGRAVTSPVTVDASAPANGSAPANASDPLSLPGEPDGFDQETIQPPEGSIDDWERTRRQASGA